MWTCRALVVLAAFGYPASPAAAAPQPDADRDGLHYVSPRDTLIDVGSHRLHVQVRRGTLPVTVLFEAGGAADLDSWSRVPSRLAQRTGATIVTYDRAGLGASELGPAELTPRDEVDDIREAMDRLDVPRRTVIVGHSYGAMLALDHAATYPERVVGLVLVDPMNPRFVAEVGDWLDSTVPEMADPPTSRDHVVRRMARTMDSLSARLFVSEPILDAPMMIVSAGREWWGPPEIDAAWRRSHEAMAGASTARRRIVSEGSGHDIPGEDPETIVSSVLQLLDRTTDVVCNRGEADGV